ncbi:hypothetical protein C8R44DRAFT_859205 [Mycena epipterygia]|nr:hypothetical protein C8R44DRAFT_859205 [Mycena epipterygia]
MLHAVLASSERLYHGVSQTDTCTTRVVHLSTTLNIMALRFLEGHLGSVPTVLQFPHRPTCTSPSSPHVPLTLVTLPTDVLQLILELLYDPWVRDEERGRYDHETCKGRSLLPLSDCCRYLRGQTLPWIFREVYNWDLPDSSIWPESLWPFFHMVHIRDRSMGHPGNIALLPAIYDALPMMRSLTKVTLRLNTPVPVEVLRALSLAPRLTLLEIHQARVVRGDKIDRAREARNVVALLRNLTRSLTALQISGDLLYPAFLSLTWPQLRIFTITEHTPTPYIPVPDLVSRMPTLRELSILYSADLSRDRDAGDMYLPVMGRPPRLWPAPLTHSTALIALGYISHLADLTELSLTLDDFATAMLIHRVAAVFPRLRFLELGHAGYLYSTQLCPDVRDPVILEALQQFPLLTRLRISLNFMDREFDPDTPQRRVAHWLLEGLPNLRAVAFSWEQNWWYYGFDMVVWREWDRSVLLRPPSPPSWQPSPVPPIIDEDAIPPWELDGHTEGTD